MLFKFRQGLPAHPMGGNVGQDHTSFLFEGDELRLQGVIFPVGNERRVLHIVGAGVCVELVHQRLHSLYCVVFHGFLVFQSGQRRIQGGQPFFYSILEPYPNDL